MARTFTDAEIKLISDTLEASRNYMDQVQKDFCLDDDGTLQETRDTLQSVFNIQSPVEDYSNV